MLSHHRETGVPARDGSTGAAWLSSARAVRCWVKSHNERNPYRSLHVLNETAATRWRKVGMTSSQHGPDVLGHTHATMAGTVGLPTREGELIRQIQSQFGLEAAVEGGVGDWGEVVTR